MDRKGHGGPVGQGGYGYSSSERGADPQVVLITGGNSGTGYATAKAYYDHGAKVYIACRSADRAKAAIDDIKKGGSVTLQGKMVYQPTVENSKTGSVEYIQLDLADLTSVEQCAAEFLSREERLDILFANAGIMALYVT